MCRKIHYSSCWNGIKKTAKACEIFRTQSVYRGAWKSNPLTVIKGAGSWWLLFPHGFRNQAKQCLGTSQSTQTRWWKQGFFGHRGSLGFASIYNPRWLPHFHLALFQQDCCLRSWSTHRRPKMKSWVLTYEIPSSPEAELHQLPLFFFFFFS